MRRKRRGVGSAVNSFTMTGGRLLPEANPNYCTEGELWQGLYARMGERRTQLEEQVTARLKTVLETETQDWYSTKIVPARAHKKEWRAEESGLPRQTRNNILDVLSLEGVRWNGTLDDVEFLSRIFDLQELPSFDTRSKDAAGDNWQHCINNDDWESDWVLSDRDRAKADRVEVVIHRPNGQIRDSDSYGNDPNPPKDRKH